MALTKKIFLEIWKFKKLFIIASVAGLVSSLLYPYISVLTKQLFDAFEVKDLKTITRLPWMMLGIMAFYGFFRYWNLYFNQFVGDCVSTSIRTRLHQRILKLNLSFHSNFEAGSGGLMSRIFNDVTQIEFGVGYIVKFIREPIIVVSLLGWITYLNWKLTIGLILVVPILLAFLRKIAKSLHKYGHRSQEELERLTSIIKESLDGLRVIQSFGLEPEMDSRFGKVAGRYLEARRKMHGRTESAGPVTELILTFLFVAIFAYFGVQISKGTATIGDLMGYVTALLMIGKPIKEIQDAYIRYQRVLVSADRVFDLLEDTNEVPEVPNPKPFPQIWDKIEYRNVSFRYKDDFVLRNFNLDIPRGETVALVGESGSGKSTVVSLLERFFDPTEGDIFIDGISIKQFSLKELRSKVGLVNQDVFLFKDSIHYNIRSGDFDKADSGVESAAKNANAHNFIMSRGENYKTSAGDRGGNLSGGEKQRISIARAFFKNSPILILDEATSALDSVSEIEVQKGLESLMEGRTVLVIAHRLSTVVKANKIIVMKDGRIVESGNHESLIQKQGEYFKFRNLQAT